MNIIVTKDNVKIAEQSLVHKGEYNVNPLMFSFSAEYDGLSKMAVFSTLVKTYETAITNGSCIIPYEVLKDKGILKIGVYAYTIEDDVIIKRYSPTPITIPINDGSYIPNASNPEQENPTAFEEFMQQLEGNIDDLNDDINVIGQTIEGIQGDITDLQNGKQDKLTAGTGISISEDNVISTTGEANKIESISVNGTTQPIVNKNVDISVPTATSQLNNDSGFIDSSVNNLVNYELKAGVGHSIALDIDTNYVMTLKLKNSSGQVISTGSIDLPLESVVVDGSYDSATKEVVLVLENGNTIRFSVADLVSGLQTEITSENKLASDLVDDTNQANKFVSVAEKETWNNKQNAIDSSNKLSADLVDDTNTTNKFITNAQSTKLANIEDNAQVNVIEQVQVDGVTLPINNKAVNIVGIEELKKENADLLAQIPTATATGATINVQDSSNLPIKELDLLGNATQGADPTPDSPQDIHVVTGDNTVKVLGKNLLDTTTVTVRNGYISNSTAIGDNGATNKIFYMQVKPNTTYTVSTNATSKNNFAIASTVEQPAKNVPITSYANNNNASSLTITTGANDNYLACYCKKGNVIFPALFSDYNFQVEIGNIATSYTPYVTPTTQLLSLGSIELAKIGDYTDQLFKAVQGNSIYDSLDSTTKASLTSGGWYVEKKIGKLLLNGTETNWTSRMMANCSCYQIPVSNALVSNVTGDIQPAICDHFETLSSGVLWTITSGNNGFALLNSPSTNSNLRFSFGETTENLDSFKTWLGTHNTTAYYALATPTYTQITDTTLISQLENILAMHTNKNVTNAWIEPSGDNAQGGLTLTYYRDLQTITDKIDSLEARIELLEN